jgi:polyhydroxyalkanoate synthesis regulator phasin
MSNEFNARKTDPNLQARFEERDPKLIQGFNRIKEDLSPDVFENDPIRLASMPLDRMKNDYISEQANIRTLYDKANRAAGGSQAPIDIGALRENIINGLKEKQRTRYVPPRLQADLDEVLTQGFMTPEQYENFRTDTATIARTSKDPLESQAASIIREKLEQVPIKNEFAQYKPLYDEARKAVAALKQKEKNPAYKAAISDTRTLDEIEAGVPHPAANNFLANHYAAKTPQVNIERMLDLIGRNSPEHQALNKLKLDEFKLNSGIKNDSGTVNQAALNKIIYHQNQSNLPVMFGNQIAKDLQDLADVANLSEPRKGVHSVNVSNTEILRQENAARAAKETVSNIAAGLTESAINMKVPFGGTILRSTFGGMKAEREAKAAAKAAQEESDKRLSPKAGIKLKDIGKE